MRLKPFVGIVFVMCVFAVGNIFLFGLLNKEFDSFNYVTIKDVVFPLAYFIMSILLFMFIINKLVLIKDPSNFIFALFCAVMLCAGLSFGATGAKIYYDKNKLVSDMETKTLDEIGNIKQMNGYYADYTFYLKSQLSFYQNSSDGLQARINYNLPILNEKIKQQKLALEAASTVTDVKDYVPQDEYYYEDEGYYEGGYEEDD